MQRRLANSERNGLEGRRPEAQQRRAPWPPKYMMGIDASKPSRSSQKSDVITAGKSVPNFRDVERPRAFNEQEALNKRTKVIIRVGTGISQQVFHVESAILCDSLAFAPSSSHSSAPSQLNDVDLPDEDPTAAEMFVEWAKRPKPPVIYAPGHYSDEPWISNAAAAWFLGHRLDAAMFQKYALSQFVQNCALAVRGPWRLIEEKAPAQSPLLRFSDHWVAWNSSLSGPGLNEYTGMNAAKHADQVKPSTRDPRILDLNHWYLDCGNDINAKCAHDPIFRANQQEKERLRKRTPPPDWGAEYELAKSSTISSPVHAKYKSPNSPSLSRTPRRKATPTLSRVEDWLRSNEV